MMVWGASSKFLYKTGEEMRSNYPIINRFISQIVLRLVYFKHTSYYRFRVC